MCLFFTSISSCDFFQWLLFFFQLILLCVKKFFLHVYLIKLGKDNECIEQPHYTYAICNAWFQAWFFSSWRLDVGPILLYNLFPIFLLHFWGFKLSKFIIFIMFRTISGHSEITDDHRRASAPLCVHRQIFLYWVTLDIEQPHYIYTICNAWFQACFFFFLLDVFLSSDIAS